MATPERNTIRDIDAITTHQRDKNPACARCGKSFGARLLCDEDGTLRDRFTIAEFYQADDLVVAREHAFVYRGHHVSGHAVFITVAREEGTSPQLQRSQRLDHPRLIERLIAGHDDALGRDFIVHEATQSLSTRERLTADALALGVVVEALSDLAGLMQQMSDDGVHHGGLSIDDLWLDPTAFRGLRVTGFCIGHKASDIGRAPERARGSAATEASDVYAFGAVAHQLLTFSQERAELRVPLSSRRAGISASVERLVTSCLSLDPQQRPTWAQIVVALGACAGDAETDVAIADPLLGTMVGSYRIEQKLGEGGMGSVYRGVHPRIQNHVAIKILHDEMARQAGTVRRFEREAKATGAIGSPYIPQIFDFGVLPDGRPYAVMEFFHGESVRERVDGRGAMPLTEVRDALLASTEALSAAHEKKIIHRDIKPDNLFLVRGEDGRESIRVLDFGIAKIAAPEKGTQLTRAGSFLGTPVYCAPEQMYGLEPTPMMDVYALGATAYEMLTGQCLYSGDVQEILEKKASRQAPDEVPLQPFPRAVRRTILKALAHDPSRRYQSMAELAAAVEQWPLREATSTVALTDIGEKVKTTWFWPIAASLAVLVFVGTWALFSGSSPEPVELRAERHVKDELLRPPIAEPPDEPPDELAERDPLGVATPEPSETGPGPLSPEVSDEETTNTAAARQSRMGRVSMRRTSMNSMNGVVVANPFDN